ncbi:MAG TPA: acyl-CoA dehydrogenase family protein [Dehalococcoidia bacterium]|jgi:3-hydroxy-9,10-secoandrosta-1,3,5(10)-triene-9,17-dione monooxygenase
MPSREEILSRASALIPTLNERAAKAEELRRIPDQTIRDLKDAGLLRLGTPKRFGGYGHDIDLLFDVVMELGRGCGSTAWCYSVWLVHNWMVGHWPERFQEEYYASGPDTLSSSGFMPTGKMEPVDGGFLLSGRWDFSSGSDAATWALLGAMTRDGPVFTMLPRSDYEILDTWFAAGLKGTGSKDIQVSDAFVPDHRVVSLQDLAVPPRDGNGPVPIAPATRAWELHAQPSYRLPMMNIVSFAVSIPIVGMAQGAVDSFTEGLRGKTGPGRTADSVVVQMRLAEAAAEVDAARVLSLHNLRELLARAARGDILSAQEQVRYQRDRIFAARLCLQALTRLFDTAGAHSVYASETVQRFFRDAHVAAHHTSLNWDAVREQYGRLALRG